MDKRANILMIPRGYQTRFHSVDVLPARVVLGERKRSFGILGKVLVTPDVVSLARGTEGGAHQKKKKKIMVNASDQKKNMV